MIVQPNSFIDWIIVEQGQDQNIITHFQHYSNTDLLPKFEIENNHVKSIIFSYKNENNIKISKGEESNFIWCIFYALIEMIIDILNIDENRETVEFDKLQYVFIDDPVSSLDENNLIEMAQNLGDLIKKSTSDLKFILTTHNPLFFNVLFNVLRKSDMHFLKKLEDNTFELVKQNNDSPFSYHLTLLKEIHQAIDENRLKKYHFNFLRNLLEKTSTFLGYPNWADLIPEEDPKPYETRILNISSHSHHSAEEISELTPQETALLQRLLEGIEEEYKFYRS